MLNVELPPFIKAIIDLLYKIGKKFWDIAVAIRDILFVGEALYWAFVKIAHFFYHEDDYGGLLEDCLAYYFANLGNLLNYISAQITRILDWSTIQELIIGWLPGIEGLITWFNNLTDEFLIFATDPITYLKDKVENVVWPYLRDEVEPFRTIYSWYENNEEELTLLFDDPAGWAKDKVFSTVWPWVRDELEPFKTVYPWYLSLETELKAFTENPTLWWQDKVQNTILPWAKLHIPLFATLYSWVEDAEIPKFLGDPLGWLYDKMEEWFERFW